MNWNLLAVMFKSVKQFIHLDTVKESLFESGVLVVHQTEQRKQVSRYLQNAFSTTLCYKIVFIFAKTPKQFIT